MFNKGETMPDNKEKLRSEIDDKYKWDLTLIYKTIEDFEKDYKKAKEKIEKVSLYKDKYLNNGKELYKLLKYDDDTSRLLDKLYSYAHLNYDADTLNEKYMTMTNKVSDLYSRYSVLSSFVVPGIIKLDKEKLNSFYKDEKGLEEYRFCLDDIYRFKAHTLDEDKEKMLSSFGNILSSPEETYEVLTDSDFEYDNIIDENKKEVTL